jgi:hypothetical protein
MADGQNNAFFVQGWGVTGPEGLGTLYFARFETARTVTIGETSDHFWPLAVQET